MTTDTRRTLLIAAHGARDDAANAMVREHARRAAALGSFSDVRAAFHLGEPSWAAALDALDTERVTVVPFFVSGGHFASTVLPRELRAQAATAGRRIRLGAPIGEHPRVASLVESQVRARLDSLGWRREVTTLVVVGHGTPRNARSRVSSELLATELAVKNLAAATLTAYIDEAPRIDSVLARASTRNVLVYPFLIGGGQHDLVDVLAALKVPARGVATRVAHHWVLVDAPFGQRPELAELVLDSAAAALPVRARTGTVYLVGAGPGAADLITIRGRRLIRRADVILHDRLVSADLLKLAKPGTLLVDVGKHRGGGTSQGAINHLIAQHALLGQRVVRLKGGDPGIFARADEELATCREQGIRVVMVPGVSSYSAGAAQAGFPLTARSLARSFAVVTAQTGDDAGAQALASVARADTIVLMMGRASLRDAAAQLILLGRDPATPVAAIERASLQGARIVRATLDSIADAVDIAGLAAPVVTVVGPVAGLRPTAMPGD